MILLIVELSKSNGIIFQTLEYLTSDWKLFSWSFIFIFIFIFILSLIFYYITIEYIKAFEDKYNILLIKLGTIPNTNVGKAKKNNIKCSLYNKS